MSKYTDWVSRQPCCITGFNAGRVDPHHIKGYSWLVGSAASHKGHDLMCIPLKHELHVEGHVIGWDSWEKKYNRSQLEEAVAILMRAAEL